MKIKKLTFPLVLVCGFPRSGTSLVTELAYMITGYPKSDGFLYKSEEYVGYNEFVETYTAFHFFMREMFPNDFWRERKYRNDIMWQEQSQAIVNFLQRKKCFIFKENYLLTTIGGFEKHFEGRKVIYVDRDISSVYRSLCKIWNVDTSQDDFVKFMKEYSESINLFTGSWAWKGCLKINYDMLLSERSVLVKIMADFLEVPLRPDIYELCMNYIKPKK